MARKPAARAFNEKELTKGQLRKLNALRKSLGKDIADRAFAQWLRTQKTVGGPMDKNAEALVRALEPLVKDNKLRIPRGGYLIRRGRGRVIVSRAKPG